MNIVKAISLCSFQMILVLLNRRIFVMQAQFFLYCGEILR